MCLIVAAIAAAVGWITLAATVVWYRVVIVPELFIGDSVAPFVAIVAVGAVSFLGVLVGAMRRTQGRADGLAVMITASFALVVIIFSDLTRVGVLIIPGFLISTLAAAMPANRPWERQQSQ